MCDYGDLLELSEKEKTGTPHLTAKSRINAQHFAATSAIAELLFNAIE